MESDLPPKIQERLRQRGSNSNKTSSIYQGSSDGKEATCSTGALGLILGSGRSPGEGNGYPLQYSYLENPMDRGAWQAIVHGVTKESDPTEHTCTHGVSSEPQKSPVSKT